jgi:hypothetical protein
LIIAVLVEKETEEGAVVQSTEITHLLECLFNCLVGDLVVHQIHETDLLECGHDLPRRVESLLSGAIGEQREVDHGHLRSRNAGGHIVQFERSGDGTAQHPTRASPPLIRV